MYNLADLLGLESLARRQFLLKIEDLESKITSGRSVSAEILGRLYQDSAEILRSLDFIDNDVLAKEAQIALQNKLLGEQVVVSNDDFWKKFQNSAILTKDGVISSNRADVEKMISSGKIELSEFRKLLKSEICEKFHHKIPHLSIGKINNLLFKEKK